MALGFFYFWIKRGNGETPIPLEDYEDKDMAEGGQDDGAAGTAEVQGYTISYVTAVATDEINGGVFGDVAFERTKVPGVKSLRCTYVADPAAQ